MAEDREFRIRPGGICSSTSPRVRPFNCAGDCGGTGGGGQVSHSSRIVPGNRSRFGRRRIASVQANHLLSGRSRLVVIKTRVVRHTAPCRSPPISTIFRADLGAGQPQDPAALCAAGASNRSTRVPSPRGYRSSDRHACLHRRRAQKRRDQRAMTARLGRERTAARRRTRGRSRSSKANRKPVRNRSGSSSALRVETSAAAATMVVVHRRRFCRATTRAAVLTDNVSDCVIAAV